MKIGDYEVTIKKGDKELDAIPDDLPAIDFEGNQITMKEAKEGYMRTSDYTQKTQSVASMRKFLQEELGFEDPNQGVTTMRNVLDKVAELQEKGILDMHTGEIKIPGSKKKDNPLENDDDLEEPGFTIGMEHLPAEMQQLMSDYQTLHKDFGSMMSYLTRKEIREAYPDIKEEEIGICLKMAAIDPSKSPMEHAVALEDQKKVWGQEAVDRFVEDQKKPKKEGHDRPGSGELAVEIFGEDPVFSYRPDEHEGKKVISPEEAANTYMEAAMKELRGED